MIKPPASHRTRFFQRQYGAAMVLAGTIGFLGLCGSAFGQAHLGADIVGAATLSSDQLTQVKAFADAQLAKLKGSDIAEREKARDALLEPVQTPGISIGFRLKYSDAVASELGKLAGNPEDHIAVNALRVAGKLGTSASLEPIRAGLTEKRASVRIGAARAAKDAIRTIVAAGAQSPINAATTEGLIEQVGKALAAEVDPLAALTYVQTLDSARSAPAASPAAAFHTRSMRELATALRSQIERIRAISGPQGISQRTAWTPALVGGIDAIRRTFIDAERTAATSKPDLRGPVARACAQSIAFVRDRLGESKPADLAKSPESPQLRTLAGASETVLILISGTTMQETLSAAYAKATESGSARDFNAAAAVWLANDGRITKPPFSLNPKEFAPASPTP